VGLFFSLSHRTPRATANTTVIIQRLVDYLNRGADKHSDPETRHKILITNLFGFVGFALTLVMGINAFFKEIWLLGVSLFIASAVFFVSLEHQRFFRTPTSHQISGNLLQLNLSALMLYLVYSGGSNNTGPLWIVLVPPVMMFFSGLKGGLRNTLLFTLCYCLLVFYPDNALVQVHYSDEFKTRLLLTLLTLTVLSGYYEHSRFQAFLQIRELSAKFEQQAHIDPLTQIANRRAMMKQLKGEYSRATRHQESMCLLLLDVDHFKRINDIYGHHIGDEVLKSISQLFVNRLRKQDVISRWGGEEFLILLPQTTEQDAIEVAEAIRQQVEEFTLEQAGKKVAITVSIGVWAVDVEESIDEAIQQADKLLYLAKHQGRNRVIATEGKPSINTMEPQ